MSRTAGNGALRNKCVQVSSSSLLDFAAHFEDLYAGGGNKTFLRAVTQAMQVLPTHMSAVSWFIIIVFILTKMRKRTAMTIKC